MVKNPVNYKKMRYINVSYHFIRELIINITLIFIYISTNKIIIDELIKVLTLVKFAGFVMILDLNDGEIWLAEFYSLKDVGNSYN